LRLISLKVDNHFLFLDISYVGSFMQAALKQVRVGLVGLGTVGSGTFNILSNNFKDISARTGLEIILTHIGARRDHPAVDLSHPHFNQNKKLKVSRDIFAVVNDPDIDILVELIGGCDTALAVVEQALKQGKHVVTANKALIAEHGNTLFKLAYDCGKTLAFEAAVAGGIPIIKSLTEGLAANNINWLAGIINGTGNFILTEMKDKGRDFAEVLKEAQKLGYAEADPSFDVEGTDAAHKLAILAALAFSVPFSFDKVYTEGIQKITAADLKFADNFGYVIKHLAIARKTLAGIEMRVHPTLISKKQLISKVDGVMNAVLVHGDAVGSVLFYGAGAGAKPTGSAVVADIIDIARHLSAPKTFLNSCLDDKQKINFVDINNIELAYYLRVQAKDQRGVLAGISKTLSEHGISIEGIYQQEGEPGESKVPVIILTEPILESAMNAALKEIRDLDYTEEEVLKIRVEHFKG
jgi:homoserine dehydrogenase